MFPLDFQNQRLFTVFGFGGFPKFEINCEKYFSFKFMCMLQFSVLLGRVGITGNEFSLTRMGAKSKYFFHGSPKLGRFKNVRPWAECMCVYAKFLYLSLKGNTTKAIDNYDVHINYTRCFLNADVKGIFPPGEKLPRRFLPRGRTACEGVHLVHLYPPGEM